MILKRLLLGGAGVGFPAFAISDLALPFAFFSQTQPHRSLIHIPISSFEFLSKHFQSYLRSAKHQTEKKLFQAFLIHPALICPSKLSFQQRVLHRLLQELTSNLCNKNR